MIGAALPVPVLAGFLLVVLASYTCAAALGFGANVVAIALGAHLLPVDVLLPAILPTSIALSATIAVRERGHVAWTLLLRRVLPCCALGFPFGALVFHRADLATLRTLLGAIVACLGLLELVRGFVGPLAGRAVLPRPVQAALLVAGGFVQGLFASGGPLVVTVLAARLPERRTFRSTLCVLWVLLNTVLLGGYATSGRLDGGTLTLTAWAVLPLLAGLLLGQRLHSGLPEVAFRRAVHAVLVASGLVLLAQGLRR